MKKILKYMIIIFLVPIILILILNVILILPMKCYYGEKFFCLNKLTHTFHIQTHPGSGNPGTSGFYIYDSNTKIINGIIEKDDDLFNFSVSKNKYKVIFQDDNFFVFTSNGRSNILQRNDSKKIKTTNGLYQSPDNLLAIYILEDDKFMVYDSITRISSFINMNRLIENGYFIDTNNKTMYKLDGDKTIKLSYKGELIPSYYNINVLKEYEQNYNNLSAYFKSDSNSNSVKEVFIKNGKVKVISNRPTYEQSLEISHWNEEYIFFENMIYYNLRYNIINNEYEMDIFK